MWGRRHGGRTESEPELDLVALLEPYAVADREAEGAPARGAIPWREFNDGATVDQRG